MASNSLHHVQSHAARREEKAALQLQHTREQNQHIQQQLDALNKYREEYEDQFLRRCSQGISARELEDYRCFLGNLNNAIAQQMEKVNRSAETVQKAQSSWLDNYRRKTMVGNLIARQDQVAREQEDKREQKLADEQSMRRPQNT